MRNALHFASGGGHHDIVRVLLERGVDPNTHDKVLIMYGVCMNVVNMSLTLGAHAQ